MERKNTQSTNRDGLLLRSEPKSGAATTSSDFVLQWGNRKRLRCMKKVQVKDPSGSGPVQRVTARRVVRSDLNHDKDPNPNQQNNNGMKSNGGGNGYLNLRQRPASPSHRILRNCESSIVMRSQNNNEKKGTITTNNNNNSKNHHSSGGSGSSETGGDKIAAVWPPKFVIGLTNKEKEEDFMAIKGSKLPHRPKKRAKFIQRTVNLVSPGAWLCDLTLERYEVREKKVIKKRPRGLKSMGNMDSESE